MKQAHINRFLSSTIVAFLLTAHVALAKSVELQAEVTNGQYAIATTNYMTNAVMVNLVPGATGAASDVKITNPADSGQNAFNILAFQNGELITAEPCGPNCLLGALSEWPGLETVVIYQFTEPQPQPFLEEPCIFKEVLAPGEFCNVRLSASPGAPQGSQTFLIKGDNTVNINVTVNVS